MADRWMRERGDDYWMNERKDKHGWMNGWIMEYENMDIKMLLLGHVELKGK